MLMFTYKNIIYQPGHCPLVVMDERQLASARGL